MDKLIEDMHVAVLAGGPGSEREVSMASAKGVASALEGKVGKVSFVDVSGIDFELPEGTDVAFNVIHGTFGEDGQLQAELERRGIPYTGARRESSEIAFDKVLSKDRFIAASVSTPASEVILVGDGATAPGEVAVPGVRNAPAQSSVGIPCVVKPPREGSSVGVHLVHTEEEWSAAIEDAVKYSNDVLVEQLITGKELTVGIVGDEALPIVHIQPRSGFYDISNKYPWMTGSGGTDYFCPADLPAEVTARVQAEALKAHQSLGVEVYSRVDVLLREEDQEPFVLEVNTIPGMTESSLLPKAANAAGMDYASLCLKIIKLSLNFD
ncbi:MAG: D-alanine--D-alanine ligase [Verrucomicrobiales bacterium]|nr:D-alanine--D-alanine ligase [Verrucomicrobiales bacterium]